MKKIAFIGVGNMASAILMGITKETCPCHISYEDVALFDIANEKTAPFCALGATAYQTVADAVSAATFVCLAVKPQQYADVLASIRQSSISLAGKTFISLAAGVDTDTIDRALGGGVAIIRTMPNTPLLVGSGVTALSKNGAVTEEAFRTVHDMFASCGSVLSLDESEMNRIISVTSSAVACFYRMMSALCHGATAQGLDGDILRTAVAQTAIGAAEMVSKHSEFTIEELTRMVTSYKGTTEQMMLAMDEADFDGMMQKAMAACTNRANELGAMLQESIATEA